MTAPAATVRSVPTGIILPDGFKSLITLAINPAITFWEKSYTPAGMDGGDGIKQDTMFNTRWRMTLPRQLITLTEVVIKAAYDPIVKTDIQAAININTTITEKYFDGSTYAYYGYLKMVKFNELVEGQQPECEVTIMPTNIDPVSHAEAGPTLVSVAGT